MGAGEINEMIIEKQKSYCEKTQCIYKEDGRIGTKSVKN